MNQCDITISESNSFSEQFQLKLPGVSQVTVPLFYIAWKKYVDQNNTHGSNLALYLDHNATCTAK